MATDPAAVEREESPEADNGIAHTGLLIDWGGVLTSNLFDSFRDFCVRMEIDPQMLRGRFSSDPAFRELLIALEKGELQEADFERQLVARQVVITNDLLQFKLEPPIGPFCAGFLEQGRQRDGKAVWPAATGVLAGDSVEPAFPAAGDGEVGWIDGK